MQAGFSSQTLAEQWISNIAWYVANMPSFHFTAGEVEDGRLHFQLEFERVQENVYAIPEDQSKDCYAYILWMLGAELYTEVISDASISEMRKTEDGLVEVIDTDAVSY